MSFVLFQDIELVGARDRIFSQVHIHKDSIWALVYS